MNHRTRYEETLMSGNLNETHDPGLRSWVESAHDPATDFPIQNLPLAAYLAEHDGHSHTHLATIIGDQVLDVSLLALAGFFGDPNKDELAAGLHVPYWNLLCARRDLMRDLRSRLQHFLRGDTHAGQAARRLREKALRPLSHTRLTEPVFVRNYTDFYASIHHATTVGSMFRPDNPLLPNYKHVPIGYHGRSSSIVASGTDVRRPKGQLPPPDEGKADPTFGPTKMLDYELEMGIVVGAGNALGESVPIGHAREHIAGLTLVNDWSARDVQKWEYQPLGPFLAKNFATTMGNVIVTSDALEPFRVSAPARPNGDPRPLAYLWDDADQNTGGYDITLEVWLRTQKMREGGSDGVRLSQCTFKDMYWTPAQLIAHHTCNGCNLLPGDLLASGTISGPAPDQRGCLLELTWDGRDDSGKPRPRKPITLPNGETRLFLADGDEVTFRAYGERQGARRIGFGECTGRVIPAAD